MLDAVKMVSDLRLRWNLFQTIHRHSWTAYVSTVLITCVRWSFSRAPVSSRSSSRSTSETTLSTTRCVSTRPPSSNCHGSIRHTIQNTTSRLVFYPCNAVLTWYQLRLSVCLSVRPFCPFITSQYCVKTAEQIQLVFGILVSVGLSHIYCKDKCRILPWRVFPIS